MAEPAHPRGAQGLGDGFGGQRAAGLRFPPMKSWPGLLRVLGGLELLGGGAAFTCICADIQQDYRGELLLGGVPGGGSGGPLTPFVLGGVALGWLLTAALLGLGATPHYHRVLLEAPWWPPTESGLNGLLFLLSLGAAGGYVHTVSLGGLCYSPPLAGDPLLAVFCRPAGGRAAALVFLFLTALLYLAGSLVAIKMWRDEVGRRRPEAPPPPVQTKRVTFEDEVGPPGRPLGGDTATEGGERPGVLTHSNPPVLVLRPCAVPDYVVKYPAIRSGRQREGYRAVFCDQHAEYRELLGEVREARRRLGEMEAAARHALRMTGDSGVARVWHEVLRKKRDSAFLEKQRRCRYLQEKLKHIKRQIQDYDCGGAVYF
ncbi:MARVEL domain-containing protein 2-like isoform X1 [Anas acuta]|uniref:MARVEL domain-containing protein 2-like isoform X1 n=2 Tax=Anas acuta TaxID=28680 RepID=UPI0035C88796